ncbi:MAG: hypothetical protein KC643_23695, partial [Nitrospira sp.]|nr:hypothetical protein [Nitrospira sp.]
MLLAAKWPSFKRRFVDNFPISCLTAKWSWTMAAFLSTLANHYYKNCTEGLGSHCWISAQFIRVLEIQTIPINRRRYFMALSPAMAYAKFSI